MNVRLIILLFIESVVCDNYNVGTVLFTFSDLSKSAWDKKDLQILKARSLFQTLIPSPNPEEAVDDKYLDNFFKYVDTSHDEIDKHSTLIDDNVALHLALSDAFGGFIKTWVLPAMKYGFYAGIVSQDNALKLMTLYDNIKIDLTTDGRRWMGPDDEALNYMKIEVASIDNVIRTRNVDKPCEHLVYFEVTDSDLRLPTPSVYWHDELSTMFLPLRNQSLIPLTMKSDALLRYYDAATRCLLQTDPDEAKNFDDRFLYWLNAEVVPHINDSTIYVALSGFLTLLNSTDDNNKFIFPIAITLNNEKPTQFQKFKRFLCKKKYLLLTIFIFLEIAWCIPAVMCVCISKRKKASKRYENSDTDCLFFNESVNKTSHSTDNVCFTETSSDFRQTSLISPPNNVQKKKSCFTTGTVIISSAKKVPKPSLCTNIYVTDIKNEIKSKPVRSSHKKNNFKDCNVKSKSSKKTHRIDHLKCEDHKNIINLNQIRTHPSNIENLIEYKAEKTYLIMDIPEAFNQLKNIPNADEAISPKQSCVLNIKDINNKIAKTDCTNSTHGTIHSATSIYTALENQESNRTIVNDNSSCFIKPLEIKDDSKTVIDAPENLTKSCGHVMPKDINVNKQDNKDKEKNNSNVDVTSKHTIKAENFSIDIENKKSEDLKTEPIEFHSTSDFKLALDRPKAENELVLERLVTEINEIQDINNIQTPRPSRIPKRRPDPKIRVVKAPLSACTSPRRAHRSCIPKNNSNPKTHQRDDENKRRISSSRNKLNDTL